jgi:tetrahydromethanopterin S-methyltransferase subunit G
MRKFVLSVAAAASALAVAAPAAAQYYPAPPVQGYGYGYNNLGTFRALQARVDNVERQINRLDRRDRIGNREGDRLRREANRIENRLHKAARYGLNPYESNDIHRRIAVLEQRVNFAASNGWSRYGNRYGWNSYSDRDHDGRNDRYEDDGGRRHD